ncbi:SDR family NAD(P)-dependent oxidoreductase [Streptomyces yaizuensis]|uniref:Glucose 1-dehydrogenase n=1 Tax=Streptomyces yaizuensis TaxID=2989713 RepID=A0ABQ5P445_9ACTN|nr:glucose 1-dehydrogenase [Streptomyces sp. YSPA8]GLF97352.1 glucose 1-dehydrogenase [Streptomyces sp. YSPA8]
MSSSTDGAGNSGTEGAGNSGPGRLDGRVVLITGAARGQGEHEARLFAAEGARVVLTDVLHDRGRALAEELGGENALYVPLDVRREEEWAAAVAAAKERFGRLDGLVNNAGVVRMGALVDIPLEDYHFVIGVNQTGTLLGIRALAPEIEAAGGGTIVNIASVASLIGMTTVGAYVASKHAVLGLTRVAALELAAKGIRVNAICPGGIDTPMADPVVLHPELDPEQARQASAALYKRMMPLGRIGRPEEIARLALFLTSADSSYITGQPFVADGGWLAGAPMQ